MTWVSWRFPQPRIGKGGGRRSLWPPLAFPHSPWLLSWGQMIPFYPVCGHTLRARLLSHACMVVASVAAVGLCATTAHPCRCQPLTGCSLLCPGTLAAVPMSYGVVCVHVVSSLLLGWCWWTALFPARAVVAVERACGQSAHTRACACASCLTHRCRFNDLKNIDKVAKAKAQVDEVAAIMRQNMARWAKVEELPWCSAARTDIDDLICRQPRARADVGCRQAVP